MVDKDINLAAVFSSFNRSTTQNVQNNERGNAITAAEDGAKFGM